MFRIPPSVSFALKALVGVGLLALLSRLVSPREAARAFVAADWRWLALAALLVPANVTLEAYRWHRLVRCASPGVAYRESLRAVLGSYPLGLLTPGRMGEYVGRAALLRDVPPGLGAALTLLEKTATLACILSVGVVALVHFFAVAAAPSPLAPALVLGSALWAAGLLVAVLHPGGAATIVGRLVPMRRLRRSLVGMRAIPLSEARTLLGLSALRYGIFAGQFALLVLAFDPTAGVGAALIGVALVLFAKSAVHSVALGDLGVREGAAIYLLGAYGVADAASLDASLSIFALNLLAPALVGLPILLRVRAREGARRPQPAPR